MRKSANTTHPSCRLDVIREALRCASPPAVVIFRNAIIDQVFGGAELLLQEIDWPIRVGLDLVSTQNANLQNLFRVLQYACQHHGFSQNIKHLHLELFEFHDESEESSVLLHVKKSELAPSHVANNRILIPFNFATTDSDLRILQADQGFCRCTGLPLEKILSLNLIDLVDGRENEILHGIELFCDHLNQTFEFKDVLAAGGQNLASLQISRIDNLEGHGGYAVQFRDSISQVRHEKLAHRILSKTDIRSSYINQEGMYEWASESYSRYTRFEGHDLIGMPISMVTGESELKRYSELLEQVLAGQRRDYVAEVQVSGEKDLKYFAVEQLPDVDDDQNVAGVVNFVIDVTESHANALRMTDVLESSPSMVSYINRDFVFEYLNQDFANFLGLPSQEIIGRTVLEILGEERFAKYQKYYERVFAGEKVHGIDFVQRRNGSHVLIDITHVPKLNNLGQVSGFYVFVLDVTESNQNLRRLNSLLENSAGFCVLFTREAKIRFVNQTFANCFGIDPNEAVGKHLSEYIGQGPYENVSEPMIEAVLDGETKSYHNVIRLPDGQQKTMFVNLFPDRAWDGEITGFYGVAMDNTQLVDVKDELKRLYANFEMSVEHTRVGIIDFDNSRTDWCFSEHLELLLGLNRGDLKNSRRLVRARIHPDDMQTNEAMNLQHLSGRDSNSELRLLDASGNYRWFAISFHVRHRDGVATWCGTVTDIDELKNSQLHSAAQLSRRDEFLAMLSHELRNPLMAIQYSTELQNETNDSKIHAQMQSVIERQTSLMSRLLDDLLDVSRIAQNRIKFEMKEVNVNTLVGEAVTSVEALTVDKQQEICIELQPGNYFVIGDPIRLKQAIINLIHNASKYSQRGDLIKIRSRMDDGHVVIVVQDEGRGIASCDLNDIFDLFCQLEKRSDRPDAGMGVGLYLVKHIVEQHDGYVAVQSDGVGMGSTFRIAIPLIANQKLCTN